jgi:hypothetical protein
MNSKQKFNYSSINSMQKIREERRKRSLCHLLSQAQISYKLPMTCHMLSSFFFTLLFILYISVLLLIFLKFQFACNEEKRKREVEEEDKNAEHLNFYYSHLLQQNALNLDMQKQINNNNSIRMYLYT